LNTQQENHKLLKKKISLPMLSLSSSLHSNPRNTQAPCFFSGIAYFVYTSAGVVCCNDRGLVGLPLLQASACVAAAFAEAKQLEFDWPRRRWHTRRWETAATAFFKRRFLGQWAKSQ